MRYKPFIGRTLLRPIGGAHSTPLDPLAGFEGGEGPQGRKRREERGREGVRRER